MHLLQEYRASFERAYPQTKLDIRIKTRRGQAPKFRVGINGDFGDIELSESDMREAVRNFNRGRVQ